MSTPIDITRLHLDRNRRLRSVMERLDVPAVLTADPINVGYACGHRNMTVYGMMGPSRFVMVIAGGPTILFEFAGCDHLSRTLPAVDEVRTTTTITANSGSAYRTALDRFAAEVADELRRHHPGAMRLAVEKVDFEFTDALRRQGIALLDGMAVMLEARRVKLPIELGVMREATRRVDIAVQALEASLHDGVTENSAWSEFHRQLIANDGEYVVARLFQSGPNTFPYFRESSERPMRTGELVCLDTDATGYLGYAVDYSRTFVCGGGGATPKQRDLFALAFEQLQHNARLLGDGVSFHEFAHRAWPIPDTYRPYGYYCLAHGLGVAGEHPNVPLVAGGLPYDFEGRFETDMVVCIESYIGDPDSGQGVKLEDQYVVTPDGAEPLSTYPFADSLVS